MGTGKLRVMIMIIIRTLESCPQCQAYSLSKQRLSTRNYERPTLDLMTTHIEHRLLLKKTDNNPEPKAKYKRFAQHFVFRHFFPKIQNEILTPCILVGRPEVKKTLGRPGRRWEDNIKMDLQEVRWGQGLD